MTLKLLITKLTSVILLMFFTMQGCVKFEPDTPNAPDVTADKVETATTDNNVKRGKSKGDIRTHRFSLGTVFSFNHFIDMEFEIESGIDQNGIVHVSNEKGSIFLSASAATVNLISRFKVDTVFPVETLYVSYEKESKRIVKKINIVKGLNSVTLR